MPCQHIDSDNTQCTERKIKGSPFCSKHQICPRIPPGAPALWQTQSMTDYADSEKGMSPAKCYPVWMEDRDKIEFDRARLKYLASVVDTSVDLNTKDKESCRILKEYGPTEKYYNRQIKYVNNLTTKSYDALRDYSHEGDEIINNFLRGKKDYAIKLIFDAADRHIFFGLMAEVLNAKELNKNGKTFLKNIGNDYLSLLDEGKINYWNNVGISNALEHVGQRLNEII